MKWPGSMKQPIIYLLGFVVLVILSCEKRKITHWSDFASRSNWIVISKCLIFYIAMNLFVIVVRPQINALAYSPAKAKNEVTNTTGEFQ
jgi:hypothetical protein